MAVRMNKDQQKLLNLLGISSLDGLDDDQLLAVEDLVENDMQINGLNHSGDGLNERGELCRSILVALASE